MLLSEFKEHNEKRNMPRFFIGQGMGFKEKNQSWNDMEDDEIIYIPEYGYSTTTPGCADRGDAYSKQDFKDLVTAFFDGKCSLDELKVVVTKQTGKEIEDVIDYIAEDLFTAVDWQYPTTLIDEGWLDDYIKADNKEEDTISVSVNLKMDMKIVPSFMEELKRIVDHHIDRLVDTESFPEIKEIYGCSLTEL